MLTKLSAYKLLICVLQQSQHATAPYTTDVVLFHLIERFIDQFQSLNKLHSLEN